MQTLNEEANSLYAKINQQIQVLNTEVYMPGEHKYKINKLNAPKVNIERTDDGYNVTVDLSSYSEEQISCIEDICLGNVEKMMD